MSARSFLSWVAALTLSILIMFVVLPLTIIFAFSLSASKLTSKEVIEGNSKNRVAVLELEGVILDSRELIDELYKQADDEDVKGIVLRINSPGGAIGPAQEIFSAVKKIKAKKPVVASMGAVAASGGLYAALGASKVFCQPGTLTGSIGVILQIPNVSRITDMVGFQMTTVKSGALKDIGNAFRPMTEGEQAYLQTTIDTAHTQFVQAVSESRNIPEEKVREFADGRMILGSDAVSLGLADGFGDIDSAARAVFEILKEPLPEGERPSLVYPLDEMEWLKNIINTSSLIADRIQGNVQFQYILK